jgi:tetratricopeptide (TPR) repeat protein
MGKKSQRRNGGASGSRGSGVEACLSKKSSTLQERGGARAATEVPAIVTTNTAGDEAFAKLVQSLTSKEEFDCADGAAVDDLIGLYRVAIRRRSTNKRSALRVLPQQALFNLTSLLMAAEKHSDQIQIIEDHLYEIEYSPQFFEAHYAQIRYVRACFMSGQLIKAELYADRIFVEHIIPSMRDRDESGLVDIDQLEFKAEMLSCCAELCRCRFRLDDVIDYGYQSLQTWDKISTLDPTNEAKIENIKRRQATIYEVIAQAFGIMGKSEQSIEKYNEAVDILSLEVIKNDPTDAFAIEYFVRCTESIGVEYAKMKEWGKAEKYISLCLVILKHHKECLSKKTFFERYARALTHSGSFALEQYEEDRKGAPQGLLDTATQHTSSALQTFLIARTHVGGILTCVFVDKSHQEYFVGNICHGCKLRYYCNKSCQKLDWRRRGRDSHKNMCVYMREWRKLTKKKYFNVNWYSISEEETERIMRMSPVLKSYFDQFKM